MALPSTPFIPGFTFMDLGPDGGPYDETQHPKGCIHSTEGSSLSGAESAYKGWPPHCGYDARSRVGHQYVRLDRHSMAFKGGESDDEFVVQIELIGFAAHTHTYPEQWYRNVGEDVIRPLTQIFHIPANHLRMYRQDEGIILASPNSPIRLTDSAFRNYSGWLAHQHVPAPDAHWDAGGFLMDKALYYAQEQEEDTLSWDQMLTLASPLNRSYTEPHIASEALGDTMYYTADQYWATLKQGEQLTQLLAIASGASTEDITAALEAGAARAIAQTVAPVVQQLKTLFDQDDAEDAVRQANEVVDELVRRLGRAADPEKVAELEREMEKS